MARLILIGLVKENQAAFEARVNQVSASLGVDPNFLMIVMYKESRLNHRAINSQSGATGLIQFMPSTARSLGTTTASLAAMSNVQQLDYVEKYLRPYKSKMKRLIDLYLSVFYPVAVGKPETYIIARSGSINYTQNAGLDIDRNGQITVADVEKWLENGLPAEALRYLNSKKKNSSTVIVLVAFVLLTATYYAYAKGWLDWLKIVKLI